MQVINRKGEYEKVSFDKIIDRLRPMCEDLDINYIDSVKIAQETITSIFNGITTSQIDTLSADICASKIYQHPDFNTLAARISVDSLHKRTHSDYKEIIKAAKELELISDEYYNFVNENYQEIQNMIDYKRDYLFDYFGFKTLERSYLLKNKVTNVTIERPQHLIMRVSIQIHGLDGESKERIDIKERMARIKETYDLMSNLYFTHATPTLFNSGSKRPQLSSCFLIDCQDNIESIFTTGRDIAYISKWAGGIGVYLSHIRGKHSLIRGTNGLSEGIVPLCKYLESIANYINQGGKRNGSIAVYIEPWHSDIFEFLELRKNIGDEKLRARDLFLALWVPDLFMKRVISNGVWSLMCPDRCPGLVDCYGEQFEQLYEKYEKEGKYTRQVNASTLWKAIIDSQIETGMPYFMCKDNVNHKSNQKNIDMIRCSNLCSEITEVSNQEETAVCNLGSICLPKFVNLDGSYDFDKLRQVTKVLTKNLNKVIDVNFYPTDRTKASNLRNRPIGLGVQGLADVFCKMNLSFESKEANDLNRKIFEHIYFACLEASNEIAERYGSYSKFEGSPFSEGKLQWHLWGIDQKTLDSSLDWNGLIEKIKKTGTANSLLTTCMPTASTSQIMGNCESIEPYTSNIYVRKTMAGEYIIINQHLVKDLIKIGKWDKNMYNEILFFNGSVQNIRGLPISLKEKYKTSFEIKQKTIVDQSIARGPFIDQSQSLNLNFSGNDVVNKIASSHMYGWKNGLKTCVYYTRTQLAVNPIKFGLDPDTVKKIKDKYSQEEVIACVYRRKGQPIPEGCEVCSG